MTFSISALEYKSQCLKKVNVKYMISRLWHEMFHIIVPGISPRPISALQLCCRAWYRSLGMIPGPIWKMSCNNLLILLKRYQTMLICKMSMTLESVCKDVDIWMEIPIQHDVYIWANCSVSSYLNFIPIPCYQPSTHVSPPASLSGLIWESRTDTRANMENVMY
jgi:hypothetical protein